MLLVAVLVTLTSCQYNDDEEYYDSVKPAKICLHDPTNCSRCDVFAECTTSSTQVVPRTLNASVTRYLNITYVGDEVELQPDMFSSLTYLEELAIHGNLKVIALHSGTFAKLPSLTRLLIDKTKIISLPSSLFAPKSLLQYLTITNSKLAEIPTNIFGDIPNLTHADFKFNSILHTNCSSIGEPFRKLNLLKKLNLANMTVQEKCMATLGPSFFSPIELGLEILNLTAANLNGTDPNLFSRFENLKQLDIGSARGFSDCPSSAADLFWNLPQSLEVLFIRRWRSDVVVTPECIINETSIAGLKNLTNLKYLDAKWSDMIFGKELLASTFDGFDSLTRLELGWCQFSQVEEFAFDNCPSLTHLSLNGNPLGAQPVNLYSNGGTHNLVNLGLKGAGIYSDFTKAFPAFELLRSAPVSDLDLRDNLIHRMPIFTSDECPAATANLRTIKLDKNYLKDFWWEPDKKFGDFCYLMPNLRKFSVRENRLENIE